MIDPASRLLVSRNDDTKGGICAAIWAIRSSPITPGPLGISETNPMADAPRSMAIRASAMLEIQQIFTRVMMAGLIGMASRIFVSYLQWNHNSAGRGKAI